MAVVISFKSHVMLADSLAGDVDVRLKDGAEATGLIASTRLKITGQTMPLPIGKTSAADRRQR